MQPAAVHEDAAEQRQPDRRRARLLGNGDLLAPDIDRLGLGQIDPVGDLIRDRAVPVGEVVSLRPAAALEEDEDQDVERDDRQGDDCRPVTALVLVADREHRADDRAGPAP